jgi:ParB/Sulfiredoxin domain
MTLTAVSTANVVAVAIENIEVGPRRREKLGRVKKLAASIQELGLIHPILLRGHVLVAGHRRLEACKILGWRTIPARQLASLSEDAARAIELDENTHREALSDYAASKARLAQIKQAEADLKAKASEAPKAELLAQAGPRKRGRPKGKAAGSSRSVADETGISRQEQSRTERHVELAERYPFLQRPGWVQYHVLKAGDVITKMPEDDRPSIAALLDQDGIPPAKAIEMLRRAEEMTVDQRREVIRLAQSADEFERRRAITVLGDVPPPADPALQLLDQADHALARAATVCRSPRWRPLVIDEATRLNQLLRSFRTEQREVRNGATTVR